MWHKVRLLQMSEREKLPKLNKEQINKPSGRNKWSNYRTFRRRRNGHNRYK
jgi:hypothetical protein